MSFGPRSPYSPFFTAGLCNVPAHRRAHQADILGARRGSLPSLPTSPVEQDEAPSEFYFTLQPARDESQLRSFLSLDLAESQSVRSVRRRPSNATNVTVTTDLLAPPLPLPNLSLPLRRTSRSRDSLRAIPSPKPVPSPSPTPHPPPPPPPPPTPPPPPPPPPPLPAIPTPPKAKKAKKAPVLPPLPPAPRLSLSSALAAIRRKPSTKEKESARSVARTFSITSSERRARRADALAALEGRDRPHTTPTFWHRKAQSWERNAPRSRFSSASSLSSLADDEGFLDMSDDDDDFSDPVPSSPFPSPRAPSVPLAQKPKKGRRSSWFPAPLASFIEMADDEWNWRAFVEVAGS